MKEGWDYNSLGKVCKIYNGNSINADYKKTHYTGLNEGYPFIATKDVSFDGTIDYANGVKIPFDEGLKVAKPSSVFICVEGGSAGRKVGLVDREVCFGNKLFCLESKGSILGPFIYYYLKSGLFQEQFAERLTGLIGGVSAKKFNDISIIYPSLSEQQSIVDYLDSAFAKIDAMKANAEKALNEAKALFQASLKEMLEPKEGWVTSTLKDECFKITDGTHQTPKYFDSGYIFLSSKNVTSRKIDWKNVKFIDESQHQIMHKRVAPQVGDILLAKNGTTGVAAMVDRDVVFDIYVSLALLRTKGNVTPEYLLTFVNSPIAKEQFDKRLIGMGVPNLHLGEINKVVITYPIDKEEQAKVTQKIEELDNQIIRLQENFDKISQECDALKQAILRQVFD